MNKYIDRLASEWKQHGKIIIAVDFDDTISPWRLNEEIDCLRVIEILKETQFVGVYISIFTACNETRYDEIRNYCQQRGLVIDSINANPISLPYGNQNKIYANIFIDDRAGMEEALTILQEAMYRMRSYKSSKSLDNPSSTEF